MVRLCSDKSPQLKNDKCLQVKTPQGNATVVINALRVGSVRPKHVTRPCREHAQITETTTKHVPQGFTIQFEAQKFDFTRHRPFKTAERKTRTNWEEKIVTFANCILVFKML